MPTIAVNDIEVCYESFGREDPLVTLSGGEATAAAVPGADLLVLGLMGHDTPPRYWSRMADAIFGTAVRAESD